MNNKELINKIFNKSIKELKGKIYPYKHTKLLDLDVELYIEKISEDVAGLYRFEDNKHKIFINELYFNDVSLVNSKTLHSINYHKQKIKEVITHELIHAFVNENWSIIKHSTCDYSPVFLSILYWVGGVSGHIFADAFKNTELFKRVMNCKTYEEVMIILCDYCFKIRNVARELTNNNRTVDIEFQCSPGIKKIMHTRSHYIYLDKSNVDIENVAIRVGFLANESDLREKIKEKLETPIEAAEFYEERKMYINENRKIDNVEDVKKMIRIVKSNF